MLFCRSPSAAILLRFPEAAAVDADIPVGNIVYKDFKILDKQIDLVVVVARLGARKEFICAHRQPQIGRRHFALVGHIALKIRLVDFRVRLKERVNVPELTFLATPDNCCFIA